MADDHAISVKEQTFVGTRQPTLGDKTSRDHKYLNYCRHHHFCRRHRHHHCHRHFIIAVIMIILFATLIIMFIVA